MSVVTWLAGAQIICTRSRTICGIHPSRDIIIFDDDIIRIIVIGSNCSVNFIVVSNFLDGIVLVGSNCIVNCIVASNVNFICSIVDIRLRLGGQC